jgi:hypothetical protein
MGLHVFLQILWALEALSTEVAFVRLERHMHTDMGGDVVPLDRGRTAQVPTAGQIQVVGTLAADVSLTDVVLVMLSIRLLLTCRRLLLTYSASGDSQRSEHLSHWQTRLSSPECCCCCGRGASVDVAGAGVAVLLLVVVAAVGCCWS